jgi:hypothetical protein
MTGEITAPRAPPAAREQGAATVPTPELSATGDPMVLRAGRCRGRCGGPRRRGAALQMAVYGVMVVANASVRLLVLPLLVWMKTDLKAVPLFARPM